MKIRVDSWEYVAEVFLQWAIFRTKVVEKIKTYFVLIFFENLTVYEIMCKNMVYPDMLYI